MKSEKTVAKLEGGRTTPASGALWHSKADVKSASRLAQVKQTAKRSYALKLSDLETIERQAAAADLDPVLIVEFITARGTRRYMVQPYFGVDV